MLLPGKRKRFFLDKSPVLRAEERWNKLKGAELRWHKADG
jgi:hypothetical protein